MKNKILILVICVIFVLAVGGVTYYILRPNKIDYVVVIGKSSVESIEYWNVMRKGFDAGAKEHEIKYEFVAPKVEADIDVQKQLVDSVLAKNPDGIILIPTDYEKMKESAQKIIDHGIPLICVDCDVNVEKKTLISTDNYEAGRRLGVYLKNEFSGKALLVSQNSFTSSAIERERGARDGLGNGIEILPTVYSDSNTQNAYTKTHEALRDNPDVACVIGLNEPSTVGAAMAAQFSDRDIIIGGFDSSIAQIQFLEEGSISVMAVQKPFNMGYLAMKEMSERLNNPFKKPETFYTQTKLINKENMHESENEKLIFMFADN